MDLASALYLDTAVHQAGCLLCHARLQSKSSRVVATEKRMLSFGVTN